MFPLHYIAGPLKLKAQLRTPYFLILTSTQ